MQMIPTRIHITDSTDPYHNLAVEELLLDALPPGEVVLYLWQNDHTIVIGRNQDAWRECRVDAFEESGGHLARRLSGGGAVYHDMGNQNFTFLAGEGCYDLEKQTEVIRLAARRFGIEAVRSGRNDIEADGRKFSGNAFYGRKGRRFHHGTILISSDMGQLGRYLNPSADKLAGKGVKSVRARVVNLCELSPGLTPALMRPALQAAFAEVYGGEAQPVPDEWLPPARLAQLREKYASAAWRLGTPFTHNLSLAARLSFGEVMIQLEVARGQVAAAKVYSDAMDAEWAPALAEQLLGLECTAEALAQTAFAPAGAGSGAADEVRRLICAELGGDV